MQWRAVRERATATLAQARAPQGRQGLLGIYLNDHLAGATMGTELAQRIAGSRQEAGDRETFRRLTDDISSDRQALLTVMGALGVPVRRYKAAAAWMAEKTGRLKLNGHLLTRSPLSSLEELELLRLGVEGKAAGWRTLRELAQSDSRLDPARLDELISRAREQADLLEELRVRAAARLIETRP